MLLLRFHNYNKVRLTLLISQQVIFDCELNGPIFVGFAAVETDIEETDSINTTQNLTIIGQFLLNNIQFCFKYILK